MRAGQNADLAKDYDRAIVEYTKALREDPDNRDARAVARTRQGARVARPLLTWPAIRSLRRLDEALVELQLAAELNPGNADIDELLRNVRDAAPQQGRRRRDGKTELQTLVEKSRELMPAGQELPTDIRMPESLTFRDANSRDVFTALGKIGSVNVIFDPQFRARPVSIDLKNPSFEEALQAVSTATRNFYRVTAQRTVTVIPDTAAKRQEYEEEIVRPVLPEQRRSQRDDGPAARRDRRATRGAGHGDQRDHDQGHAGASGGRRQDHRGDRQGAARGRHRRRAARGRSHAPARVRSAARVARRSADRHRRRGQHQPRPADAARSEQPDAVRHPPDQSAEPVSTGCSRHDTQHAHPGQSAAADVGRDARAGAIRRAGAGAGDDVLSHRHRRCESAADHVVQLREHRREHRHHAAHPS